ncbi:MAG: hypothetical protein Q6K90_06125 [Gloeomargarita sp. HHBFW_bins_162]
MWQNLQRPTCTLRLRWGHFYLKLGNGLEIQGRREQLTALTVLVLAYLSTPPPPSPPAAQAGELVPLGESLPVPPRYALQFGGLAPAMNLTLQELHDLAWVLEAAQTPRFPWWQHGLGWLALGTGLILAVLLARLPRPVELKVVTRLIPGAPEATKEPPLPSPPPTPLITLNTVTTLPPPPPGTMPTISLPEPPGDIAPPPPMKTAAPPELQGVQNYFRQRWQPPENLPEPLTYRLVVTPQGTLSRIMPLSPAAGIFLDQTPMPLVGETFMGSIPKTAKIQLELAPNGQVRVWFEGWES